ncbi:Glucose/arabinose dehydrogenase, beta-propeller fold [Pseudidiomarina maritima]|uniref:Glucose/arabinose dehydrogenase, beta-propeller fold n=1 Tax=Pseudidiomarina maritima TaxID=519453 RepID=A0A1I6HP42_9GAMM|nr:PQQ-dependent sugar dehydrogenase [Pseudidiomarina maritima]SFR56251.1 Glucose/arabinose dehydrogenase, beta-propeller fold [Pseudidiomarina maritima]
MKQLIFAISSFVLSAVSAQAATVRTEAIADKLNYPWSVAELPEGGFLVTERSGQLLYVSDSGDKQVIKLDLPDLYATAQAGLFEVLLTPDFVTSRELVISYSCGTEDANNTCVVRTKLSAQPPYIVTNSQNIFTALPKKEGAAHYGARMTWLADNTLLVALGDGFVYREQAQNLDNHLGKIVRITRNGKAPADNPFFHSQAPEIFSYGHRNVQGLIYDQARDSIWQHEHGPKGGDELNKIVKGGNYGWPIATFGIDYTGAKVSPFSQLPGVKAPLYQWTPSLAPAGLALYQGDLLVAHLAGKRLQRLRLIDDQWQLEGDYLQELNARLRAVYVAPSGRILVLTDSAEGKLLQVSFED